MLQVIVPSIELFDDDKQEFLYTKAETLQLEHSLLSLSKWEEKWCKPFLGKDDKTNEQTIDYIRCMTINKNVSSEVYDHLPSNIFTQIRDYIRAPMTATWFNEDPNQKKSRDIVTAEVIYYWMISQNIPVEFQKWHLNKLLTLIRVCNLKNAPPKKMGKKDMLAQRQALNDARRAKFKTKG